MLFLSGLCRSRVHRPSRRLRRARLSALLIPASVLRRTGKRARELAFHLEDKGVGFSVDERIELAVQSAHDPLSIQRTRVMGHGWDRVAAARDCR